MLIVSLLLLAADRWGDIFAGRILSPKPWITYQPVLQYLKKLQKSSVDYDTFPSTIDEIYSQYFYSMKLKNYRNRQPKTKLIKTLSIGSGDGTFEKNLVSKGFTSQITVTDISVDAIARAKKVHNDSRLLFLMFDGNRDEIRERYDFIFCHHSLHHIENLEHLYEQVYRALVPGGIFAFEDYVGPSRYQWTPRQLSIQNMILKSLPHHLRLNALDPNHGVVDKMHMHTQKEMLRIDPSEAVRSSDILPILEKWFGDKLPIIKKTPMGGNILHPLLNVIGFTYNMTNPEHESIINLMCVIDELSLSILDTSDYVVVVTKKDS